MKSLSGPTCECSPGQIMPQNQFHEPNDSNLGVASSRASSWQPLGEEEPQVLD